MILISNLILSVLEGSTVASTEIYGVTTYVNIGSGNVFNLSWNTPTLENDIVDHYNLVIKRHDPTLNVYYDIFSGTVGLVNEFYVNSTLLPTIPLQYVLSIYVVAYGKQGSVITSNVVNPYISKGSGGYVKVEHEGYEQSIMKRALAFAKTAQVSMSLDQMGTSVTQTSGSAALLPTEDYVIVLTDINGLKLQDSEEKTLITAESSKREMRLTTSDGVTLLGADGNELFARATKLLNSINGWELMQDIYTKGINGEWLVNDIEYEILITGGDAYYDEPVEVIVGEDTYGNPIYEPLYSL